MPLYIRDRETDVLVRALARKLGCGLTDAVKLAVAHELARDDPMPPMIEQIRVIQGEIAAWPRTGLSADKAFFDVLSADDD